ncbi:MAG: hypothetical protein JSV43_03560 [Methanobacteriota archaeon]|nr:MAG: hypothetical protein JSV43_03560 [Euryarchaeota archaeon]
MKLWAALYLMVWISVLEFILVFMVRISNLAVRFPTDIHLLVGIGMLVLAQWNVMRLDKTNAPDRIKRICKATRAMIVIMGIFGLLSYLSLEYRFNIDIPFTEFIAFVHLVLALTVIAQASSVATSYDMWEEKEYQTEPEASPEPVQPTE